MKLTTGQALILFGLLTEKIKTLNNIGDTLHSKVMHEDRKYYIKLRDEIIQANKNSINETID